MSRNRHLALAALLIAAPLLAPPPLVAQCSTPQGNATLGIGGLAQPGSSLNIALSGKPNAPFLLAVDIDDGPLMLAGGGQICLGPTFQVLFNGFAQPFFAIPPLGTFQTNLTIPDNPLLVGQTFFFQGVVYDTSSPVGNFAISNMVPRTIEGESAVQVIWSEDFEAGWGSWFPSAGVWEIGDPGSSPADAHGGTQCAATVLNANYPASVTSRLRSPSFFLPTVEGNERLALRYWTFHSYGSGDSAKVQVSTDGGSTWVDVACTPSKTATDGQWTQALADLTLFAGQLIRIGLHHAADCCGGEGPGWAVDDLIVQKGVPFFENPQGWADGMGPWWAPDHGLWEVGTHATIQSPISGGPCAATNLEGNYPASLSSRLVSPPVLVPGQNPELSFWQRWSLGSGDVCRVQISTDGGCTWTTLVTFTANSGGVWTPFIIDLSAYAGQVVRLAFRLEADCCGGEGDGWYVDDISIQ